MKKSNKTIMINSSPHSSNNSNNSKSSQPTNPRTVAKPIFRGEFKSFKIDKPKKMSKSKTTKKIDQVNLQQPNSQKKESIMGQLTFHESYSKDLCPFGKVKVKTNPVRNHPYVQQFVLNTCQSTSSVIDSGNCINFATVSNVKSPKLSPMTKNSNETLSNAKIPQRDNCLFHFKVGNQPSSSTSQQSLNSSFNSSSSCSSTMSSLNNSSSIPNQKSSELTYSNPKPIIMETIANEQEFIILPPFRQVDKSENIKIPSIKYIDSLIHAHPARITSQ